MGRSSNRRQGAAWPRRSRNAIIGVVVTAMSVTTAVPFTGTVHAADPQTAQFADALDELGMVIATVSQIEELGDAIPLTGITPGGSSGLDLLGAMSTATGNLTATLALIDDAPGEIADELEANDITFGSTTVAFGCDAGVGDACAAPVTVADDAGVVDYEIPVSVAGSVTVPLLLDTDVFDMDGQEFTIDLTLSTTLVLRFDTTAGSPDAFTMPVPPTIELSVGTDVVPDISASSRIGVADVAVTLGGLDLDLGFEVDVADPDGIDGLTRSEWLNTQIVDLVATTDGVTRVGTLAGTVDFDTDLIPGAPDGSVDIGDTNLSDGFQFMLDPLDLNDLVDFTLISPAAIIAGIGQAAAGIGGAQAIGDVPLPLLDGAVREIAQASRPILDAIDSLGVVCGTEGGTGNVTPAGSIEDLEAGTPVFCRAIVTTGVESGSVAWTPVGASPAISGVPADGSVGITPTKNVEFTMDVAGDFDVSVAYTATLDDDNDPTTSPVTSSRTSTLPPLSVQQLAVELDALGDFDAEPADLIAYTTADHALRVDLAKTADPAPVDIPLSVGDQLEAGTGIAGLQAQSGHVTADADGVGIDLTAGVFLLPPEEWDQVTVGADECPDPSVTTGPCADALNLFFVEVDPADGQHEFVVQDATFGISTPPPR